MATHASILAWGISMDRGAWRTTVHKVAQSRTQMEGPGVSEASCPDAATLNQM